jgi:hypothetical protein
MPRFRFQIRVLMAIVALVAVAVGAGILHRRRTESFRERAYYHNAVSHQLEMDARFFWCHFAISPERRVELERERTAKRTLQTAAARYHHLLSLKYQAAAARPWYPVSADPPPPPFANPKLVSADDY